MHTCTRIYMYILVQIHVKSVNKIIIKFSFAGEGLSVMQRNEHVGLLENILKLGKGASKEKSTIDPKKSAQCCFLPASGRSSTIHKLRTPAYIFLTSYQAQLNRLKSCLIIASFYISD